MKIFNRKYNDSKGDFHKLWCFLLDYYKTHNGDTSWTIGRLSDWKYGIWHEKKQSPHFMENNCQLFTNMFDDLLGFAIAEEGDKLFHLFAKTNYEGFLLPKMLAFVEDNWVKEDGLATEISEDNKIQDQLLLQKGYTKNLSSQTTIYNLSTFKRHLTLPEGYRIVNLEDNQDYQSKMALYLNGFDGRTDYTSWDQTIHSYNRESPAYNARFDFSVIDTAGNHVSGCVCFIDFENNYCEIEKVCTHTDHRRLGLSSTLIQHAMEELKAIGIQRAEITGYSMEAKKTYEKVGPVRIVKNYRYEKSAK